MTKVLTLATVLGVAAIAAQDAPKVGGQEDLWSPSLMLIPEYSYQTWDRPHIYLQIADESQRKPAIELRERLRKSGYTVTAIQNVSGNEDVPTQSSELRFFTPSDLIEAQRIAKEVETFFGSGGIIANIPQRALYVSHARQYEIWFSAVFHQPALPVQPEVQAKPTPTQIEDSEELWEADSPDFQKNRDADLPLDHALFAVARIIPDQVYIHRPNLDGVAVAIFRGNWQEPTLVARHDFRGRRIAHIEWSPDSRFLLFTTTSSSGHSAWNTPAILFCVADKSFRNVDAAIGDVVESNDFHFEPPDVALLLVQRGNAPDKEVKVSLAKTVHQMPLVK